MTRPTQAEKLTKQYQQFWTGSTSEISLRRSAKKS
jgi:hypothetical protein